MEKREHQRIWKRHSSASCFANIQRYKLARCLLWLALTDWRLAQCVLLTENLIMKTIEIKQKLVEEALDQLKAAQQKVSGEFREKGKR